MDIAISKDKEKDEFIVDVDKHEIQLVVDAYRCISSRSYSVSATNNGKSIWRKAEKIILRNSKVYYRKRRERFDNLLAHV